jgi:hypothetical protein
MKLKTLRDLYVHELKDIYSGEKQIVKALAQNDQSCFPTKNSPPDSKSTSLKPNSKSSASRRFSKGSANRRAAKNARGWRGFSKRVKK